METAILTVAYVVLAALGCGYVLLSAFLGHLGDGGDGDGGHGDAAHAGGEGDAAGGHAYGIGGEGHGAAHAGAVAASFHFPFFSPLALATLAGSFGAYGLIARHGVRVSDAASVAVALPAALVTAYLVTYAAWRLALSARGSSQIRLADLEGAPAEVITPIPSAGIGEVAAMVRGQRYTGPARSADGTAVPRGAQVRVLHLTGATLIVAPAAAASGAAAGGIDE